MNTTIHLQSGWNLVGFPSYNLTYEIQDLIAATGATRVEGFDQLSGPHHLQVLADTDKLQVGYAYWVRVGADAVWTIESH